MSYYNNKYIVFYKNVKNIIFSLEIIKKGDKMPPLMNILIKIIF